MSPVALGDRADEGCGVLVDWLSLIAQPFPDRQVGHPFGSQDLHDRDPAVGVPLGWRLRVVTLG